MRSVLLPIAFVCAFAGMWVFVAYRIARSGWTDLVPKYGAKRPPSGKKLGAVSGQFPKANYQGSLAVWLSPEGLFIRPVFLFRSFHPPLLIPWKAILWVSEEKQFLYKHTSVEVEVEGLNFLLTIPGHHESEFSRYVRRT